MKHLFLTGYEGVTTSKFISKLKKVNITTVIDVREIPLSRKNGFSKKYLSNLLSNNDIKYYHITQLGSPSLLRKKLKKDRNYMTFFENYGKYLSKKGKLIDQVVELVINNGESSALLCFERESDLCHRAIIATRVLKKSNKIAAIHI